MYYPLIQEELSRINRYIAAISDFLFAADEQEVLVQLKRRSSENGNERFRRPGLNEDMSDKERKLAQAWGVAVGLTLPSGD